MLSKEEIEEAITKLKRDTSKPLACGDITIVCIDDLETVLKALDNSISKEVIENKKNQMLEEYKEVIKTNSTKAFIMKCQIEFAEELLEGK